MLFYYIATTKNTNTAAANHRFLPEQAMQEQVPRNLPDMDNLFRLRFRKRQIAN